MSLALLSIATTGSPSSTDTFDHDGRVATSHSSSFDHRRRSDTFLTAMGKKSVVITIRQSDEIKVVGFRKSGAVDFVTSANDAWRRHFVEQVDQANGELSTL